MGLLKQGTELRELVGAAALANACTMSQAEQCARMRLLRANVRAFDAGWWADRLLADAQTSRDGSSAHSAALVAPSPYADAAESAVGV